MPVLGLHGPQRPAVRRQRCAGRAMLTGNGEVVVQDPAALVAHEQNRDVALQPNEPIRPRRVVPEEVQARVGEEVEVHDAPIALARRGDVAQGCRIHLSDWEDATAHSDQQRGQGGVPRDEPSLLVESPHQALQVIEGPARAPHRRHVRPLLGAQELPPDGRERSLQPREDLVDLAQHVLLHVGHRGRRQAHKLAVVSLQDPLQPLTVCTDGLAHLLDRLLDIAAGAALGELPQGPAVLVAEAGVQDLLDQGALSPQGRLQRLDPEPQSAPLLERQADGLCLPRRQLAQQGQVVMRPLS
mmetsp:Transcript_73470/g.212801  ORF Transcript_73470/g.212801 Transcript_73470/m.212801 type:complete len:299 (+) Transcript_73470:485-1381(+)